MSDKFTKLAEERMRFGGYSYCDGDIKRLAAEFRRIDRDAREECAKIAEMTSDESSWRAADRIRATIPKDENNG